MPWASSEPRRLAADRAEPDDAHRLACERRDPSGPLQPRLRPAVGPDLRVEAGQAPSVQESGGDHVLGCPVDVDARCPDDADAARARRVEVDALRPDAALDDQP